MSTLEWVISLNVLVCLMNAGVFVFRKNYEAAIGWAVASVNELCFAARVYA